MDALKAEQEVSKQLSDMLFQIDQITSTFAGNTAIGEIEKVLKEYRKLLLTF